MSHQEQSGKSGLVFGARNLGGAIIDTLIADGWAMAGVARSTATLEKIAQAGALALEADVTDQASVTRALARATEANGRIDLVVNAASTYGGTRTGPFGGGPIAEASAFGVRAITQAAALELRPRGIHVALLIVDAGIQHVSGAPRQGVAPETL